MLKMLTENIRWDDKGLVPVIVQDASNNQVLMLAYMNEEALKTTLATGRMHFFSRSRQKLWMKGETSGNVQLVRDIKIDCDGDTLLVLVDQTGVACHTGNRTCFYNDIKISASNVKISLNDKGSTEDSILQKVFDVINDRKLNPKAGSYTCSLFERGIDVILKKVGEESSEVIIAAKNNNKDEVIYEACDLLYHLLVLLSEMDISLDDIYCQLNERR